MSQLFPVDPRRALSAPKSAPVQWTPVREEASPGLAPLDLREIFALLLRRVWLIVLVTAVVTAAAVYLAYTAAPSYDATASIRLTDARRVLTSGLDDQSNGAPPQSVDPVLSEIQVLTSRAVAGTVIDTVPRLQLEADGFPISLITDVQIRPALNGDTLQTRTITLSFGTGMMTASEEEGGVREVTYGAPVDLDGVRFTVMRQPDVAETGTLTVLPREAAITNLLGSLKVQPRENTDVIDVTYTGSDPHSAQQAVNAVVKNFRAASRESAQHQSRVRRQFVGQQLHENDSLLASARLALSTFRGQEQSYSAKDKFTAEQSGLAALEARREQLQADRRVYASVLADVQNPQSSATEAELRARLSAPGTNPNPVVLELLSRVATYKQERDSLTSGLSARAVTSPEVQRADTLLASAQRTLQRTMQSVIGTLDTRIAELDSFEARNSAALTQLSGKETKEARLTEQVASFSKMGDQLRDQYQKARLAEAVEVGRVEILDFATLPTVPTGLGAMRKVEFGLLLGLLLGSCAALFLEYLNTSIRHRNELESALQLPGLVVIPKFERRARWRRMRSRIGTRPGKKGGAPIAPRLGETVVAASALHSEAAEAYRQLRTKLLFSQQVDAMKTIMVTSALPQDGKTTIAANLATTFAQQKMRVLLIDCDLRRPAQHALFGLSRGPGLSELLSSDDPAAQVIRATSVDGLCVITAGAMPDDPSELLGSARMRSLLKAFASSVDVVVLDSPPVLAVTDATVLASMVDGVLLAVRAGQTDRSAAQLALQQLTGVGARMIGAVLNDPDRKVLKYEEYYHRAYRAYQGA